jgi:hypothetical protein
LLAIYPPNISKTVVMRVKQPLKINAASWSRSAKEAPDQGKEAPRSIQNVRSAVQRGKPIRKNKAGMIGKIPTEDENVPDEIELQL